MPLYDYQAFNKSGKRVKGTLEAANKAVAKERLRDQNLTIAALAPSKAGKSRRIHGDQLATFTTLLAQLVDSGVPLFESLSALEEQYRGERFHSVLTSLCDQVKSGSLLSEAMANHPDSFNRLYCAMVAAGEASGALGMVLERLGDYQQKQQKLRTQITTAMIYPAVLASFSLVVVALLLLFVVPSIEAVFEGRELNGFTEFILELAT